MSKYLINDSFTRTDSDTVGGGWTEANVAATNERIESNQLAIKNNGLVYQSHGSLTLPVSFSFKYVLSSDTNSRQIYIGIYSDTSLNTSMLGIRLENGNNGANNSIVIPGNSSAATFSTDTTGTRYFWIDYSANGGNVDINVYDASTFSKPGSPTATLTNTAIPGNTNVKFAIDAGDATDKFFIDDVIVIDSQATPAATITDGVKIGDIATALRTSSTTITDGIKIGDSITTLKTSLSTITDGVKIGENVTATRNRIWTAEDEITTTWTDETEI